MLSLLIDTAQSDVAIRAVILEGSRAIPEAGKDPFQDYDVIYGVKEIKAYRNNPEWIKSFGDLMILQLPDLMGDEKPLDYKFTYLMQFLDGNRIDLTLYLISHLKEHGLASERIILLDKDNLFDSVSPPGNADYLPRKPSEKEFLDCTNEFWWVATYVAKGLWRRDLGYARTHLEEILRTEVMKMMNWYYGTKTEFKKRPGKYGKNFRTDIEPEFCDLLELTYRNSSVEEVWQALFNLCSLFRKTGILVAEHFHFHYPVDEDRNVTNYLVHVKNLPSDAGSIY